MMVWSAGLAPVKFAENLDRDLFALSDRGGRILVDEQLRAHARRRTEREAQEAMEAGSPPPVQPSARRLSTTEALAVLARE